MPRTPDVRWSGPDRCWVSDCGEPTVDRSGRRRRKRVCFRADEWGAIPYGPKPRSEGYRRARAAMRAHVESQAAALERRRPGGPIALDVIRAYLRELKRRIARDELERRSARDLRDALRAWAGRPEDDPVARRRAGVGDRGGPSAWRRPARTGA